MNNVPPSVGGYVGPGADPRSRRRPSVNYAEQMRQEQLARERHLLELEKLREERRALAEKRKQAADAARAAKTPAAPRPSPAREAAATTAAPSVPTPAPSPAPAASAKPSFARPVFGAPSAEQTAEINAPSRAFANRQLINVYGDDSPVAGAISAYRGAQHDVEAARAREQVQAARAASDAKINKQISEAVAPVFAAPMKVATPTSQATGVQRVTPTSASERFNLGAMIPEPRTRFTPEQARAYLSSRFAPRGATPSGSQNPPMPGTPNVYSVPGVDPNAALVEKRQRAKLESDSLIPGLYDLIHWPGWGEAFNSMRPM